MKRKCFKQFLKEIEIEATNLYEVCQKEVGFDRIAHNLINQAANRLVEEVGRADKLLQDVVMVTDSKGSQPEFIRIASQILHNLASPLAILETIAQSTSLELADESRMFVRSVASRIRDVMCSFKKTKT